MSGKYSPAELQAMARAVLKDEPGDRSMRLYIVIAQITGLSANEVRRRIVDLANSGAAP